MSARVYLTSGRVVDVSVSVSDVLEHLKVGHPSAWFFVGDPKVAAFRVGAVEAVIAV